MANDKCIPNSLWYGFRLMYKTDFCFSLRPGAHLKIMHLSKLLYYGFQDLLSLNNLFKIFCFFTFLCGKNNLLISSIKGNLHRKRQIKSLICSNKTLPSSISYVLSLKTIKFKLHPTNWMKLNSSLTSSSFMSNLTETHTQSSQNLYRGLASVIFVFNVFACV